MRNLIQSLQELAQMLQNLFDLNKIDPARKYRNIINTFRIPLPYKYMKWGSIAIITIAFVITFLSGIQNGQIIWGIVRNESGGLAWGLLVFTIYVSLACKLFQKLSLFDNFSRSENILGSEFSLLFSVISLPTFFR